MPALPTPGQDVHGYRIVRVLGRGGMGVVYEAEQVALGRPVALKVLSPTGGAMADLRDRFAREARIAARLDHPNVVPIHDHGSDGERLWIAMRLVRGGDLGRRLRDGAPLPPEEAVDVVEQVADALDAAHAAGLVHRDVKPGNVLLEEARSTRGAGLRASLVDFGITKALDGVEPDLTRTRELLGTVDGMAPEQIEGGSVTARTDVYALACVLYETLTGASCFTGTAVAKLYAHVNAPRPQPSASRPDLAAFDDVVARGMAVDPEARPPSAGDLARAARIALEGRGAAADAPEATVARGEALHGEATRAIAPALGAAAAGAGLGAAAGAAAASGNPATAAGGPDSAAAADPAPAAADAGTAGDPDPDPAAGGDRHPTPDPDATEPHEVEGHEGPDPDGATRVADEAAADPDATRAADAAAGGPRGVPDAGATRVADGPRRPTPPRPATGEASRPRQPTPPAPRPVPPRPAPAPSGAPAAAPASSAGRSGRRRTAYAIGGVMLAGLIALLLILSLQPGGGTPSERGSAPDAAPETESGGSEDGGSASSGAGATTDGESGQDAGGGAASEGGATSGGDGSGADGAGGGAAGGGQGLSGSGWTATAPGSGWAEEQGGGGGGAIRRSTFRRGDGAFLLIDHTPSQPAAVAEGTPQIGTLAHPVYGDSPVYRVRGIVDECASDPCVDVIINGEDGGYGVLAAASSRAEAEAIARGAATSLRAD